MNTLKKYLTSLISGASLLTCLPAYALNSDLMTPRDMSSNATSNVSITNGTGQAVTVSGLFIASYDVNDCSACYGSVIAGDNVGGAVTSFATFTTDQTLAIGQNFLYNMIYNGIYFIKNTAGSSPCALPGCSWPGDDPNIHGWCVTINVTSLDSTYTSSSYQNGSNPPALMPLYAAAGNSTPYNYKYDLIDPTTLGAGAACIGPIVCNDQSLTCTVSTPQNERFQSY